VPGATAAKIKEPGRSRLRWLPDIPFFQKTSGEGGGQWDDRHAKWLAQKYYALR